MFPDSSHSGYSDSQGVYTTGEFGFVGIRIQCFHFKFRIQKFPDSWRNRKVLIPDSCFVCKRQNESGTKTFRIRHESWNICSGVNGVLKAGSHVRRKHKRKHKHKHKKSTCKPAQRKNKHKHKHKHKRMEAFFVGGKNQDSPTLTVTQDGEENWETLRLRISLCLCLSHPCERPCAYACVVCVTPALGPLTLAIFAAISSAISRRFFSPL